MKSKKQGRKKRLRKRKPRLRRETILKPSIWKRILRALPALIITILLTYALVEGDKLRQLEAISQDIQMRLSQPPSQSDVALVLINDEDFKEIFNSTRPLNPVKLHELINAVAKGAPKLIAVDLNTSDPQFKDFAIENWWPPIVWGRMILEFDPNSPKSALPERPVPLHVLGGQNPDLETVQHSALPTLIRINGVTRFYQRLVDTASGEVQHSIPWAVVKKFDSRLSETLEETSDLLMINYAGDRMGSHRTELSATEVLDYAAQPGWSNNGYIKDDIVLIGGDYQSEDRQQTPLGEMLGVRIIATAIETELSGGGIKRPGNLALFPLWVMQGVALVLVFHFYPLLRDTGSSIRENVQAAVRNMAMNLILISITVILCSLIASRSLAYWSYFIPIAVGLLIYKWLDQLNDWRKGRLSKAVSDIVGSG